MKIKLKVLKNFGWVNSNEINTLRKVFYIFVKNLNIHG